MDIFKFFNRKQSNEEPFDKYFADLKYLIRPCNFGSQEDKLLRAQITLGCNSRSTQEKLLREDFSLDKTVMFCKSAELTDKNLKLLSQVDRQTVDEVKNSYSKNQQRSYRRNQFNRNRIGDKDSKDSKDSKTCSRCKKDHYGNKCPAFGAICKKCDKPNHFAAACKTGSYQSGTCHELAEEEEENSDSSVSVSTIFLVDSINKKACIEREIIQNWKHLEVLKLNQWAQSNCKSSQIQG